MLSIMRLTIDKYLKQMADLSCMAFKGLKIMLMCLVATDGPTVLYDDVDPIPASQNTPAMGTFYFLCLQV